MSTREASRKGLELLEKVGARLIGVVVWGLDESRGGGYGYGYGYGYYASGYYYASYYAAEPTAAAKKKKPKKSRKPKDSGAVVPDEDWVPEMSAGRRLGLVVGAILKGILGFAFVAAILIAVLYLLARYFGWDLSPYIQLPTTLGL